MKKEFINEHDLTKRMISAVRTSNMLNEAEEGNDVITPSENSAEYKEEVQKISDTIDPRFQITKFKIYPRDMDAQLEGRFYTGINFYMSVKSNYLKISLAEDNGKAKIVDVDKDFLDVINKLNGYYKNWALEWAKKLNTEYKQK